MSEHEHEWRHDRDIAVIDTEPPIFGWRCSCGALGTGPPFGPITLGLPLLVADVDLDARSRAIREATARASLSVRRALDAVDKALMGFCDPEAAPPLEYVIPVAKDDDPRNDRQKVIDALLPDWPYGAEAIADLVLDALGLAPKPVPDVEPAVWSCRIGCTDRAALPDGADKPMRHAVMVAYEALTGHEPQFVESGWGDEPVEWAEFQAKSAAPLRVVEDVPGEFRRLMTEGPLPYFSRLEPVDIDAVIADLSGAPLLNLDHLATSAQRPDAGPVHVVDVDGFPVTFAVSRMVAEAIADRLNELTGSPFAVEPIFQDG